MTTHRETPWRVFEELLDAWEDGENALINVYGDDKKDEQRQQMRAQKSEWHRRFMAANQAPDAPRE